jgi:AcrR family transcriptional regulator
VTAPARGRRPGSPDTRTEILAAAQRAFGERGFGATTIRAIATDAGVGP